MLRGWLQMTIEVGLLTGVVVFGIFGSLHQTVTRRRHKPWIAGELSTLRQAYTDLAGEFGQAPDQFGQIRDTLLAYSNKRSSDGKELGKIVAEVKLLQGLVDRLSVDVAETRVQIDVGVPDAPVAPDFPADLPAPEGGARAGRQRVR